MFTYSHYQNLLKTQIPKWECLLSSIYLFSDYRSLRFYALTSVGAFFIYKGNEMEYEQILKELKKLRREKKISGRQLAEAMGKSKQLIVYLENGSVDLKLKDYLKICEVLEISPCALLVDGKSTAYYKTAEQLCNLSDRDFLLIKHLISLMESPIEAL